MPKKEDYEQQESMLTLREVEEMLGISRQALHNIRKAGLLKGMRVGLRAIRFAREDVEAYLAARKESPVRYKKQGEQRPTEE